MIIINDKKSSTMKQIIAITGIFLLSLGMFSCENQDVSFPDFDYTTTYFPYQFPFRTLVLGDYIYDNTNDNQLKFLITANMGGVYKNTNNITVDIEVDPTLTNNLYKTTSYAVSYLPLPTSYYTLSSSSQIIIPSGKYNGTIEVQLTDAFLNDPLAIAQNYVIPLKITGSTTDSVLSGKYIKPNADPRVANQWVIMPKNYTLFGIKYVNQYHGKYLLRGKSVIKRAVVDTTIEPLTYRQKYVESSEVVLVKTGGRDSVTYENAIRLSSGSPGKFEMGIKFDANGNGVITKTPKWPSGLTGTATFAKNAESWGGQTRHAIYLNYVITESTRIHTVKDTLVFRDKNVIFETFTYAVKP
jgi:hypothetical protein